MESNEILIERLAMLSGGKEDGKTIKAELTYIREKYTAEGKVHEREIGFLKKY